MITEYEKAKAIQHTDDLASLLINNGEGALYYKIFANFITKSYPTKKLLLEDSALPNSDVMIGNLSEMLKYMVMVATEGTSQKNYTTGQLSKFFGVSITSINNWINEDRFIGIQRSVRNKQVRIPENAMWRSPNGELILVKEIVDMWNKENLKQLNLSKDEEIIALQNEIQNSGHDMTYGLTNSAPVPPNRWYYWTLETSYQQALAQELLVIFSFSMMTLPSLDGIILS